MSSRVQKGGTIFKPLAKQRTRSANPTPRSSSSNDQTAPLPTISSHPGPSPQPVITNSQTSFTAPVASSSSQPVPSHVTPFMIPTPTPSAPPPIQTSQFNAAPIDLPFSPRLPAPPSLTTSQGPPMLITTPIQMSNDFHSSAAFPANNSLSHHPTVAVATNQIVIEPAPENDVGFSEPQNVLQPTTSGSNQKTATTEDGDVTASRRKKDQMPAKEHRRRRSQKEKDKETEEARPKRKKSKKARENESDDDSDVESSPKRKRSAAKRGRRRRASSTPVFDPFADRGEDIDPTVVTMAALCEDTGQGRISSKAAEIMNNHAAWKVSNRERRARMRAAMERKKYGLSEEEPDEATAEASNAATTATTPPVASTSADSETPQEPQEPQTNSDGFDYSQDLTTRRFNVQVRIGPNGETVIDEESLVVDRVEHEDTSNYTHVVESDTTKFVNSGTYGKRFRGSRWSAEETELFYDALAQYGENYELISYVLPGRDRRACKNKFKTEDKKNPGRINQCLNNSIPIDINTLSRVTGKDFSGPVPVIKAPTPAPAPAPAPAAQPTETTDNATTSENHRPGANRSPSQKSRKRSRSRTGAVEEGIQIIGDIDGFEP
ncbi:hypothetical protein D9758_002290 [Tetrapyrgos nigripes]|uniref:Transcription factor TFIIIB component B n=1 Tax=Tetrapyrgos nigripes TaxID=182062 RepID=A0A8H5GPG2_9AGAR|nr:hypothetical protein D9758_002290 [Tetrapyrgos nigripes]